MSFLPTRILNMKLNRQAKIQAIVLKPATRYDNITLNVDINGKLVRSCLYDTGARACVLPKAITDRIGIRDYEETNELMTMIDGTTTRPLRKVANVEVKIADYTIPKNFLIVEMESSFDVPVILGRPFIASTGAIVDVVEKSVMFTNLGNLTATKRFPPLPDAIQVYSSPSHP